MKKILHLNVKKCYFEEVKKGIKKFEYRLINEYWYKKLEISPVPYSEIHYKCGYPKNGDTSKIIIMPYKGFEVQEIKHELFGKNTVQVYAIKLTNA